MVVGVPEGPLAGNTTELEGWMDRRVFKTGVKGGLVVGRQRNSSPRRYWGSDGRGTGKRAQSHQEEAGMAV